MRWRGFQRDRLQSIGLEAEGSNLDAADYFQPILVPYDSLRALGPHEGTHFHVTCVPATVAARFSGVELHAPAEGMWLRFANRSGNNFKWELLRPDQNVITANAVAVTGNRWTSQLVGFAAIPLGGILGSPSSTLLLPEAFMGDGPAGITNGAFCIGSAEAIGDDVWVPPGYVWAAAFTTANVTGIIEIRGYVANESRVSG